MNKQWASRRLRDIAEIRVSNVDKKVFPSETPVKLCNYMDVYVNDYVTATLDFMLGSASKAEIERFGIARGDVIITKDSETPDDIGVPAVVIEDIPDLVCGYHLCLVRPKNGGVDSVYLAKQLATSDVARYFARQAGGSTRFGLSVGAIENLDIPFAPPAEQAKIAEVLSMVDRAIEQTENLIAKQQRIKTGLMQDLLTRGIDKQGNLRSEETHDFKDSPLGRIPLEWAVKTVGEVFEIQLGKMLSKKAKTGHAPFPYLGNKNVQWDYVNIADLQTMDFNDRERHKFELRKQDVLVCEGGEVGRTCLWREEVDYCYYQKAIHRLRPKEDQYLPELFPRFMRWKILNGQLADFTSQTSIAHLTKEKLERVPIAIPDKTEQDAICARLDALDASHLHEKGRLEKFHLIKSALMQDLLTGEKRVTPLVEPATTT